MPSRYTLAAVCRREFRQHRFDVFSVGPATLRLSLSSPLWKNTHGMAPTRRLQPWAHTNFDCTVATHFPLLRDDTGPAAVSGLGTCPSCASLDVYCCLRKKVGRGRIGPGPYTWRRRHALISTAPCRWIFACRVGTRCLERWFWPAVSFGMTTFFDCSCAAAPSPLP